MGDNTGRLELCRSLQTAGATLAAVIQPFTTPSPSATVGAESVVLAGTVAVVGCPAKEIKRVV